MSHHTDLAEEVQTRPRQTEIVTTAFSVFLIVLPKEHFPIILLNSACREKWLEQREHTYLRAVTRMGTHNGVYHTAHCQGTLSRECLRGANTEQQ